MTEESIPRPRGLACVSPERRREIARLGGRASTGGFRGMDPPRRQEVTARGGYAIQTAGLAHHWTPEEAAVAGRKGGRAPRRPARQKEAS